MTVSDCRPINYVTCFGRSTCDILMCPNWTIFLMKQSQNLLGSRYCRSASPSKFVIMRPICNHETVRVAGKGRILLAKQEYDWGKVCKKKSTCWVRVCLKYFTFLFLQWSRKEKKYSTNENGLNQQPIPLCYCLCSMLQNAVIIPLYNDALEIPWKWEVRTQN